MRKRVLIIIFSLVGAIFAALSLAACTPPHRYAEEWSYNDTKHWKECICIHDAEPISGEHEMENNICKVCGYYKITEYLTYKAVTYSAFGMQIECYEVTGYNGSGDVTCLGLPSQREGKPVIGIGKNAFSGNRFKGLKQIIFGSNITYIGDGAFANCVGLENLALPESLTNIGAEAFKGCSSLKCVTIHDGISALGARAFANCTNLSEALIGKGLSLIDSYTFEYCALKSVTIPETVTLIKNYAFFCNSSLSEITLSNDKTEVEFFAFYGCNISGFEDTALYSSIASTPDVSAKKVIIDWRKETNLDVAAQSRKENLGCVRDNNIDIKNSVKEITFIGSPDKTYKNLTINICSRKADNPLTIKFSDFKFTTNTNYAIKPWDSEAFELTVINSGACSIDTRYNGGHIFGYSAEDGRFAGTINFTGDGTLNLTAGAGAAGANGGTAVFAGYVAVNGVTVNAKGGDGGDGGAGSTGSRGTDGGHGGHAIILTGVIDAKLANNKNLNATGGSGGRGGNGGNGKNESGMFGGSGGNGGNGANGGNGGAGVIDKNEKITKTSGSGGDRGWGGIGGSSGWFGSDGRDGGNGNVGKSADEIYKKWNEA